MLFPARRSCSTISAVNASATSSTGVEKLSGVGRPAPRDRRNYVDEFGLTQDDVPALVGLVERWGDDEHFTASADSPALWAPIHAWRALGELGARIVLPTLLALLESMDDGGDDWLLEEVPEVCAQLGPSAIDELEAYLLDTTHPEYGRVAVAHGLERIAVTEASARDNVVAVLADALQRGWASQPDLNGFLVTYLTRLRAVGHADLIKRAFESRVVSEMICGDWPRVAHKLGLGPEPPRQPSLLEQMFDESPATVSDQRPLARRSAPRSDKSARKRQRQARKKNRRR